PRPPRPTLFPYTTLFRSYPSPDEGRCPEHLSSEPPQPRRSGLVCEEYTARPAHRIAARTTLSVTSGDPEESLGDPEEASSVGPRSEEHTSELQSRENLVC